MNKTSEFINRKIKLIRYASKLNQSAFAHAVGVTANTVCSWENGRTAVKASHLMYLLEKTGISPKSFYETPYGIVPTVTIGRKCAKLQPKDDAQALVDINKKFIARKVYLLRGVLSLTQAKMALVLGVSRNTYAKLEQGVFNIGAFELFDLLRAFFVIPSSFFEHTDRLEFSATVDYRFKKDKDGKQIYLGAIRVENNMLDIGNPILPSGTPVIDKRVTYNKKEAMADLLSTIKDTEPMLGAPDLPPVLPATSSCCKYQYVPPTPIAGEE